MALGQPAAVVHQGVVGRPRGGGHLPATVRARRFGAARLLRRSGVAVAGDDPQLGQRQLAGATFLASRRRVRSSPIFISS